MKHNMAVITDKAGKFLGAVRTGDITDGKNTINFHALPHPSHSHHAVAVDEELMHKPLDVVRKELLEAISKK